MKYLLFAVIFAVVYVPVRAGIRAIGNSIRRRMGGKSAKRGKR